MSPPEAHARLQFALADAAAAGQFVPCRGRDGHLFTSDDRDERAVAAALCHDCPVLAECAAVGEGESWHVFGGIDREAATKARRTTAPGTRRTDRPRPKTKDA
ncbi:WhiB family transcriptional regulator [Kytococcus sedentarius]|uniref:WhiB family transcriptional regulator n=1 Tax=Kytococcus sedentarius TaxID=1276 RepID=UPI0035BBC5F8